MTAFLGDTTTAVQGKLAVNSLTLNIPFHSAHKNAHRTHILPSKQVHVAFSIFGHDWEV